MEHIDQPDYAEAFHALQTSWALRIKSEPLFERRYALYRQAYDDMFRFTREQVSAEKREFGFDPGLLWGPMQPCAVAMYWRWARVWAVPP